MCQLLNGSTSQRAIGSQIGSQIRSQIRNQIASEIASEVGIEMVAPGGIPVQWEPPTIIQAIFLHHLFFQKHVFKLLMQKLEGQCNSTFNPYIYFLTFASAA
jgi:hypothetical protein